MDVWEAVIFVEEKIEKFDQDGIMPLGLIQRLITDSAYWYGHRHGPAKAPKHAERITVGNHGWEVAFGANSFLVEEAIGGCTAHVRGALAKVSNIDAKWPAAALRETLDTSIRAAVSNYRGERHPALWPVTNGHMLFGTQSIHVGDFIFSYWQIANLSLITE
jgi:hypothetical protein